MTGKIKSFIKKRYKDFRRDPFLYYGVLLALIQLINHSWQFYDSGYMIQPLIRVIFHFLLIPVIFFFGRNGIFYSFLIFSYVITLDIEFDNYTPFIIILIFCMIKSKSTKIKDNLKLWLPILFSYVACIIVVCQLHRKYSSHLAIHFINCFIFFIITWHFIKRKKNIKPLILDDDQKKILKDLAAGKLQKELDYFSKNTITDKIKLAIENNNLITKEQLLMRYMFLNSEFN